MDVSGIADVQRYEDDHPSGEGASEGEEVRAHEGQHVRRVGRAQTARAAHHRGPAHARRAGPASPDLGTRHAIHAFKHPADATGSPRAAPPSSRSGVVKTLVVDVGGTHVKLLATGHRTARKIGSGPTLTPQEMVDAVRDAASGWLYDRVSIGYPGPVAEHRVLEDPVHLGSGWLGFDFERAFGCPVRIANDAAMQALGSYEGGRMLFLGLGTGLGSALIIDGVVVPLELAHLPYRRGRSFEDYLGRAGLE
ncbi:MAG: ROK family protein, partial [Gemmatimonadaceae bacterium]|nr:ROK family protein [Gemmatimonadaceae bacterium]